MIPRQLAQTVRSLSAQYPVGPRQSGKIMLARALFDLPYANLEAPDQREYALADPRSFWASTPNGVILDEIQRVPDLVSIAAPSHVASHPLQGSLFENLVVMEVLKYLGNRDRNPQLYFYRDSDGNEVDLLSSDGTAVLPLARLNAWLQEHCPDLPGLRDATASGADK